MAAKDENNETNGVPQNDPIVGTSLSGPMVISSVLLFLSLIWAVYDELAGQRPWKHYQGQFISLYTSYLNKLGPKQAAAEKAVFASGEFRRIEEELKAAESQIGPRVTQISQELSLIRNQLAAIKNPFQDARARIAALTYELDHAADKNSVREDIGEVRKAKFDIAWPGDSGKAPAQSTFTFDELEKRFTGLKAREAQLNAEQAALTRNARELQRKRNEYLTEHLTGLSQQQIDGLQRKMNQFSVEIKQIHIEEAGLVDRCESCHVGIREPVALTAADMGGQRLFVSHPAKTLLAIHDPNRFGCSPCHNGNGLATSSTQKGHGQYTHWLWPLFARENSEAGCLQCHFGDRVLDHAPVLTRGRDLYELKGCVGCHRYEMFDRESEGLTQVRKEIQNLENQQKESRLEMGREIKLGDQAESNAAAQTHYARAENLRVSVSNMDAKIGELDQKSRYLMQDQKKIGPNLKDVKLKLRKEWIPVWLKDPPAFRPGTKMPKFRLTDEEIRALSAFVWQSGLDGPAPARHPPGDPARGKELFETRGCLGCHSIGEGNNRMGGEFAANLSRLGEKASYDYIVRWIHNPRERTRPYCPAEKRDLGPEDYTKHGLQFDASLERSTCPNDGHQLQVQNMTVMPSLRLSFEDTQNIASYLLSLRHNDASYPQDVSWMDDARLADRGRQLVGRYGCASCHEIKGLEDAPRIGTELTKESSKPMEQLDFGLLEHKAKDDNWYTHKGFYERKLQNPALFDQGREKAPDDVLRMPNLQLSQEDIRALTTFLLGSMDSPFQKEFRQIPRQFRYIPTDQQRSIQEGWWVIKKYNCMGCHNVQVGQKSVLSGLARYQDPDWKEQLPPSLLQEGARVNPEWLTRFLTNPAMNDKDTARNGVRTYLHVRMPTFSFSPNELRILVRFFGAVAGQDSLYLPETLETLDERERQMSRALFSSKAAPCLKCHLVGDERHDRFATAPNFLLARERLKPAWTARWMLDPQAISPGTAMPSGLFRHEGDRWTFAGPTPDSFKGYSKDHVQLLVRYMFQFTPEEQRRLIQTLPATTAAKPPSDTAIRAAVSARER
jgi:cytochrome c551/c552